MNLLNLKGNLNIGDKGAACLADCLSNIETLWIVGNISEARRKMLKEQANSEGCNVEFCNIWD